MNLNRSQLRRGVPVFDWQLTDPELAIARGLDLPEQVEAELEGKDPSKSILVRTLAMEKMRAYLRAQREYAEEKARFDGFKNLEAKAESLEAKVDQLEMDKFGLTQEVDRLRAKLQQATAQPALAVSGEGTRQ